MILTCPECSARYTVDPKALAPDGRLVRCAKCKHSWKEPAPDQDIPQVQSSEAEGPETTAPVQKPQSPETPQPEVNTPPEPAAAPVAEQDAPAENSEAIGDQFPIARSRRKKRPRPIPKGSNLPALQNHKHGSILWGWYGLGAFIAIIISSFLFFQTTISEVWPPSKKLYRALDMENSGFGHQVNNAEKAQPEIPREQQFRIVETVPSKVINGDTVTLKVAGSIVNLTDKMLPLPLLRISLKDDRGEVIREWTFKSSAATISKGGKVPFSTSLPNPPENATGVSVSFAGQPDPKP